MKKENQKKSQGDLIVDTLAKGNVVAAPTDTVYGLLADATNEIAIKKVLAVKKRGSEKGMPIFVASLGDAKKMARIDEKQEAFLSHMWPGKVTAILSLKPDAPIAKSALAGDGTVALRIPAHQLVQSLLGAYKKPLTGTSANRSGLPSCRDTACVKTQLSELPDLIIEGGVLMAGEPSTIVDLTQEPYRIIRKGAGDEAVKAWSKKSKCQNPNVNSNPKLK